MKIKHLKNLQLAVVLGIDVPHYYDRFKKGWSRESETRSNIGYVFRNYVPERILEKMGVTVAQAVDEVWTSFNSGSLLLLRNGVYEELDHYYDTLVSDEESEECLKMFRQVAKSIAHYVGHETLDERCQKMQKKLETHLQSNGKKAPPRDFVKQIAECLTTAVEDFNSEEVQDGDSGENESGSNDDSIDFLEEEEEVYHV